MGLSKLMSEAELRSLSRYELERGFYDCSIDRCRLEQRVAELAAEVESLRPQSASVAQQPARAKGGR